MKPPKTWICPKCENEFLYDQPVLMSGMKGRTTRIHECGPGLVAAVLTPASKGAKAFWTRVMSLGDETEESEAYTKIIERNVAANHKRCLAMKRKAKK